MHPWLESIIPSRSKRVTGISSGLLLTCGIRGAAGLSPAARYLAVLALRTPPDATQAGIAASPEL
jgi:hypothetical protein